LQTWVHIAVYGAEQLYKQKNEGKKKKEYVVNFIKEKFPQVTDKQIDILIESAVKALNIDMSILES
jgi:kynurenine formamidase